MRARRVLLLGAVAACTVLPACSGSTGGAGVAVPDGGAASTGPAATASSSRAPSASAATTSAPATTTGASRSGVAVDSPRDGDVEDSCALVTADEVGAALSTSSVTSPSRRPSPTSCLYQDDETVVVVTLGPVNPVEDVPVGEPLEGNTTYPAQVGNACKLVVVLSEDPGPRQYLRVDVTSSRLTIAQQCVVARTTAGTAFDRLPPA